MSEQPPRRSSCLGTLLLALLILAALIAFVVWRVEVTSTRVARQVQQVFSDVLNLQPKVTVNDHVVMHQSVSALELAVIKRDIEVERDREHEWLGSTKRLKLRGVYKVAAGFDLTQPFDVQVEGRKVTVEIPPPKLLSVDPVKSELLSHENGFWNRVSPADVGVELGRLPAEARAQASASGILDEAVESIRKQLKEKFGGLYEVEVTVRPAEKPAP